MLGSSEKDYLATPTRLAMALEAVERERDAAGLARLAEHQVILVGSNLLPCLVAALVLSPRRITLVTSKELVSLAEMLRMHLVNRGFACDAPVEIADSSSSREIARAMERIEGLDHAGLHYTGGKKTMSVHAYRRMNPAPTQASYLDAQTAEFLFDDSTIRIPLIDSPRVAFDELVAIHGITPRGTPYKSRVSRPELAAAMRDDIREMGGLGSFRELWPPRGPNGESLRKDDIASDPPYDHDLSRLFRLRHHASAGLVASSYTLREFIFDYHTVPAGAREKGASGYKKRRQAVAWLDGEWLEELTFGALQEVAASLDLHDIIFDINMESPGGREFQLDVACVRGHTFFAFSCTTGSRDIAKLKLFEARVRAQQLGGDHARYAVVTLLSEGAASELEREVAANWSTPNRPRVFHEEEVLNDFAGSLGEWIGSAHRRKP